MMRATASAIAAAGVATMALSARAQDTIRPGLWETTERVTSPISSTKIEQRCITPRAIAKFMTCYINHHYECVCPNQSVGDGKITFRGECVDHKQQHVHVEGTGAYTSTTLHMTAQATFKFLGIPIGADASTDAHRVGDTCPPGSIGGPAAGAAPETYR